LITVDTELSALLYQRGLSAHANFESSITGRTQAGCFGVGWQMGQLDAYGLKGVFFVDPMPGLVYGEAVVADMVGPIIERGHDVQLHIHTEWLEWAKANPVGTKTGGNLCSFDRADQQTLLSFARAALMRAGAPQPTAFRAGNYGANDDSLAALSALGFEWDTSFNADYLGKPCGIGLPREQVAAVRRLGVIEIPVAGLYDRPGHFRPAQICAISSGEMAAALDHAADAGHALFTIVTHSFEMLSRDRQRPNRMVMDRFTALCRKIAAHPGLTAATFDALDPNLAARENAQPRFESSRLRTMRRQAEQMAATWLYERRLKPA
jgi:peptidoglycan/xylan/chitin deacetylase (PgdA/CDA1 family)